MVAVITGVGASIADHVDHGEAEAEFLAEGAQGRDVAAALATEGEVGAGDELGQLQLLDEHAHEVAGVGLRQLGGEGDRRDDV